MGWAHRSGEGHHRTGRAPTSVAEGVVAEMNDPQGGIMTAETAEVAAETGGAGAGTGTGTGTGKGTQKGTEIEIATGIEAETETETEIDGEAITETGLTERLLVSM